MTNGKLQAGGLIQHDHLAMIGMMDIPSRPGVGGRLFSALSDQGINVELTMKLIISVVNKDDALPLNVPPGGFCLVPNR